MSPFRVQSLLITIIEFYQSTFSPDHGPLKGLHPYGYCRHEPTCSAYAKRIIRERGSAIGLLLTATRLLSCHPFRRPTDAKIMAVLRR